MVTYNGISFFKKIINERLQFYYVSNNGNRSSFAEDVKAGLLAEKKYLLPKYFYDSVGSDYFEKICETPEYYLTRTEAAILKKHCGEIAELNSDKGVLVELGSGASIKTKFIINALLLNYGVLHYIPIDVSKILVSSSKKLITIFEKLCISGILSEYEKGVSIVNQISAQPKLYIFLGSSIGNFSLEHAQSFLILLSTVMKAQDTLLIGFDMKKDKEILNAAYNDKKGYTKEFNLNLLTRINKELGGHFDLSKFAHRAFFNEDKNRVEIHIESLEEQSVKINGMGETINFRKGERIHTENSYKYTDELLRRLASSAGLKLTHQWKDEKKYFALCLFRKS